MISYLTSGVKACPKETLVPPICTENPLAGEALADEQANLNILVPSVAPIITDAFVAK